MPAGAQRMHSASVALSDGYAWAGQTACFAVIPVGRPEAQAKARRCTWFGASPQAKRRACRWRTPTRLAHTRLTPSLPPNLAKRGGASGGCAAFAGCRARPCARTKTNRRQSQTFDKDRQQTITFPAPIVDTGIPHTHHMQQTYIHTDRQTDRRHSAHRQGIHLTACLYHVPRSCLYHVPTHWAAKATARREEGGRRGEEARKGKDARRRHGQGPEDCLLSFLFALCGLLHTLGTQHTHAQLAITTHMRTWALPQGLTCARRHQGGRGTERVRRGAAPVGEAPPASLCDAPPENPEYV